MTGICKSWLSWGVIVEADVAPSGLLPVGLTTIEAPISTMIAPRVRSVRSPAGEVRVAPERMMMSPSTS